MTVSHMSFTIAEHHRVVLPGHVDRSLTHRLVGEVDTVSRLRVVSLRTVHPSNPSPHEAGPQREQTSTCQATVSRLNGTSGNSPP
jgi:hypothetical protein